RPAPPAAGDLISPSPRRRPGPRGTPAAALSPLCLHDALPIYLLRCLPWIPTCVGMTGLEERAGQATEPPASPCNQPSNTEPPAASELIYPSPPRTPEPRSRRADAHPLRGAFRRAWANLLRCLP